jgi:hypothetical protein
MKRKLTPWLTLWDVGRPAQPEPTVPPSQNVVVSPERSYSEELRSDGVEGPTDEAAGATHSPGDPNPVLSTPGSTRHRRGRLTAARKASPRRYDEDDDGGRCPRKR